MKKYLLPLAAASLAPVMAFSAVQTEKLDRGAIALKTTNGVFVSWRSFGTDDKSMTFDIYRDGAKINSEPITAGTNYTDAEGTETSTYAIQAIVDGQTVETSKTVSVESDCYKRLSLNRPSGGKTPDGVSYTYTPNDCSVGDVDGDGEYEIIVKWDPSNQADNSQRWYTGNVYLDCYKLDGTQLWRIDLGVNIRAGAHYTQFMVYDFDGDGKAEMACKTAPGTIDGAGNYVLMGDDDPTADYRNSSGIIMSGPEYLTMFNGETGAEITTVSYVPLRSVHAHSSSGWGDSYGNRCERYLACVAYLDGEHPSLVMCRGYYTHAYLCAWDFDGKNLTQRWLHASTTKGAGAYGEGAHSLCVGDVDGDGCDEIVYGACCINNDGSLLYRTGAGHGDALHLGDFDPDREGLEVFMVHEETSSSYKYDSEFRDAATGEIIWSTSQSGNDIGRGLVGDISETWRGYEVWPGSYYVNGSNVNATFDCKGNLLVNKRASTCFRLYWDGDLLDELFDGKYDSDAGVSYPVIEKRNAALSSSSTLVAFNNWNAQSCNTTKATPCLSADILGDWREEVILWDGDNSSDLLIFSTTIPTTYRVPCLMEDHNYRMAIAWQNVAYNQPPHLGYYLPDRFSNDARLSITSGQLNQAVELGYPIEDIEGAWYNCDSVTVTGLPEGVEVSIDEAEETFTISGTPTEIGTFTITITQQGGEGSASLSATIVVTEPIELTQVAYFSFDSMGSTLPNHVYGEATINGNPQLVEGVSGYAATMDGSNDYFAQTAYDDIQMGGDDFTISFWLRSTDSAAYIVHKGGNGGSYGGNGHWIGLELKNGTLSFSVDDDKVKSTASLSGAGVYFDGEWHQIVMTRESTTKTLNIYIDGSLLAQASDGTGALDDENDDLVIGNMNHMFDNYYKGDIDELCIYRGAMSANKVKEIYEATSIAGVTDVAYDYAGAVELTLVDATTGIIVAKGVGAESNVTAVARPGIYILIKRQGKHTDVSKIVL